MGQMCFMAENCDEPNYKTLVTALCKMRKVPLIAVPEKEELGKWAGLCKVDKKGESRRIVKTSVVVITNFGEPSQYLDYLKSEYKVDVEQKPLTFHSYRCLLYTSPSPRDLSTSRMPSSA
eukprot:TRINITY_DN789_c0_g1_i4.p1 TRINITY_DN789_c0_g1~~TRINITY_DN789_c0_g1_i4.p1  ORF type:complete len:120 (-),score=20.99 TRINITY_DN789_c0_g1_i4:144-503(-)